MPMVLTVRNRRMPALWCIITCGLTVVAMGLAQTQKDSRPKFELASIKPCKADMVPQGRGGGLKPTSLTPGRMSLNCTTVKDLVHIAYVSFANGHFNPLSSVPIEGGPGWINSDLYAIEAKTEGTPAPNEGTVGGAMLQTLLEDRFNLKIRRETREVPVYELTVAKGGLKMQRFQEGTCAPVDLVKFVSQYPPAPSLPPAPPGLKRCPNNAPLNGPNIVWASQGMSFEDFRIFVLRSMDRPVIDKTGLTGRFDVRLEYLPDAASSSTIRDGGSFNDGPSDVPPGPSIFTALEQQLGLKLAPAKGSGEFLVIDSVEHHPKTDFGWTLSRKPHRPKPRMPKCAK